MSFANRLGGLLVAAVVCACAGTLLAAAECKPARYQIMGSIVDSSGRPVADARVRLLLDRVSAGKFAAEGPRTRLVRTNPSGVFVTLIDCEALAGVTDAPNPCAGKPRHLTLSADKDGFRIKLVVFKLKELEIIRDAGGCLVQVPEVRLSVGS